MGISLLSCYHGAQIFEIYGLGKEVVDTAFFGSVSRVGGLTLADLQREAESFWVKVRTVGSRSSRQPCRVWCVLRTKHCNASWMTEPAMLQPAG